MAGEILVSARRIPRQDTMRSEPGAYVCEWTTIWSVLRGNPKNFSNNQAFCRRKTFYLQIHNHTSTEANYIRYKGIVTYYIENVLGNTTTRFSLFATDTTISL